MTKIALGLACVFLLVGCATTGSLDDTRANAPARVMSDEYDASFMDVYAAAKQACLDLGLAIENESQSEGKIYARSTANMAKIFMFGTGYGESVGIYVTKLGENKTKVEIAIQKTYKLDWGYKDYRGNLLNIIRTHLAALKKT